MKLVERLEKWLSGFAKANPKAFDYPANLSRRMSAIPSITYEINSLIRLYGRTALARSRYLTINDPYVMNAMGTFTSGLVGEGIIPSSLVDNQKKRKALQDVWGEWVDNADAQGITDFYGLQHQIAQELFQTGECFLRRRKRWASDDLNVPVQYQLIPAEMLPFEWNRIGGPGLNRIEMGIEFNSMGRPVIYHFYRNHPGYNTMPLMFPGTWLVPIPADEIIHIFYPVRAGQIRGIPRTLAAMVTLAMLNLYDNAELERKRTAALFAAFVTRPRGEEPGDHPLGAVLPQYRGDYDTRNQEQFGLEPGAVIDLEPGEDIKFSNPAEVGQQYEAFEYRMLMRAAAGLGVPYMSLTGDLRRANYGSIRAGQVEFRKRIEEMQKHVMIFQFCKPIWRDVLDTAALVGALPWSPAKYLANRTDILKARWIAPKWPWIDPLKDRQAEKLAVDAGFKSRSAVIMEEGDDPDDVDAQIAADAARATELGIDFNPLPVRPNIVGTPPTDPTPEQLESVPEEKKGSEENEQD
jgi:lambda family phage portal protein